MGRYYVLEKTKTPRETATLSQSVGFFAPNERRFFLASVPKPERSAQGRAAERDDGSALPRVRPLLASSPLLAHIPSSSPSQPPPAAAAAGEKEEEDVAVVADFLLFPPRPPTTLFKVGAAAATTDDADLLLRD